MLLIDLFLIYIEMSCFVESIYVNYKVNKAIIYYTSVRIDITLIMHVILFRFCNMNIIL